MGTGLGHLPTLLFYLVSAKTLADKVSKSTQAGEQEGSLTALLRKHNEVMSRGCRKAKKVIGGTPVP